MKGGTGRDEWVECEQGEETAARVRRGQPQDVQKAGKVRQNVGRVRRHRQGEDGGESYPSDAMPRDGTERVFDRFGGELFAILFAGWE